MNDDGGGEKPGGGGGRAVGGGGGGGVTGVGAGSGVTARSRSTSAAVSRPTRPASSSASSSSSSSSAAAASFRPSSSTKPTSAARCRTPLASAGGARRVLAALSSQVAELRKQPREQGGYRMIFPWAGLRVYSPHSHVPRLHSSLHPAVRFRGPPLATTNVCTVYMHHHIHVVYTGTHSTSAPCTYTARVQRRWTP